MNIEEGRSRCGFPVEVQSEFYKPAFRRKIYRMLEELQGELDAFMRRYNEDRRIKGSGVKARPRGRPYWSNKPLAQEKRIA